ncbi:SDR family NAD(P)-dependent oxidoreductase [Sporosarcina koreensis]|uniref:SDR family NAD(P)-dependent oxidoreductase n=1 Tax=Sporosarcina koreensis TaxID=334735 RepID=UPI00058DD434|nr:SDR family NAD(P)-dependent oxidoreductase [Sporosarcina koreensis]
MSSRKKVLITGATSGVGFETAKRLVTEGHAVQATGRNPARLAELEQYGAVVYREDLSLEGAADRLMKLIDMPDTVIFSAGVAKFALAADTSDEDIDRMFTVNVQSVIQLTQRILPAWVARQSGHFLFIGSQAGKVATPKAAVYAATKHALIGYTDALRMEAAQSGIDVTVVNPGPIDTAFLDTADDTGNYRTSVGRHLLTADGVAAAVVAAVKQPVREISLPRIMGVTSRLHALAPALTERIGKKYFMKKLE